MCSSRTVSTIALLALGCASPAPQAMSVPPTERCAAIADSALATAGLRIERMPRPVSGFWTVPDSLRSGLPFRGEFAIDTLGNVDPSSIKVFESSSDALSDFARSRLAKMTWSPAEHRGCRFRYRAPFTIPR